MCVNLKNNQSYIFLFSCDFILQMLMSAVTIHVRTGLHVLIFRAVIVVIVKVDIQEAVANQVNLEAFHY